MKKYLLSLGFALSATALAFAAKADPRGQLVPTFAEHFDALVNGTENAPATDELSTGGKIDPSLTGGLQWSGRGLHEAGGALAIMKFEQSDWFGTEEVQGYLRTPYADVRMDEGKFTARFRARKLTADNDALAKIHIELYDAYTSNAIQTEIIEITSTWATYDVDLYHPGYGNHLAFVEIASEGDEWLLDDFEIIQDYYALPAPIIHFPRNVTYEHFTARWNPVPLAQSYLVSVYTRDEADKRTYLLKDTPTTDCTLDVDGTVKGTDYYYRVRSVNDQYTSDESEERKVHVPLNELDRPVTLPAENITLDGFTARWQPTFRAMGYIINLSKEYIATTDVLVPLVHEDFNKITSGDLDWPAHFYDNIDDITTIPGWQYNYFGVRVVAGMFGLDNSYKAYGEDIHLTSPALDLSADKGNFTVRLNIYGDKDDIISITSGDKTLTHILAEQGAQSLSLQFDNGTPSTTIRIEFDGDGASKMLFFDDIYIEQTIHAGGTVRENIGSYKTENTDTSYTFTGLDATEDDNFIYTITAWTHSLDEDGVWGPDVVSEASEPCRVVISNTSGIHAPDADDETAITTADGTTSLVTVAESATAEIYTISGILLARHNVAPGANTLRVPTSGLLIIRVGNKVRRLHIR